MLSQALFTLSGENSQWVSPVVFLIDWQPFDCSILPDTISFDQNGLLRQSVQLTLHFPHPPPCIGRIAATKSALDVSKNPCCPDLCSFFYSLSTCMSITDPPLHCVPLLVNQPIIIVGTISAIIRSWLSLCGYGLPCITTSYHLYSFAL